VGDIQGAEYWLARLPLSDSQGFEELLSAISEIPDQVAKDFADAPVHLLSEDKALRLLSAMGDGESSEVLIKKLIGSAAELDPGYAVRMGLAHLAKHPDWIDLRARVVLLAVRNKEMHLVENFIGDALRWRGADPNEFLADFNNLGGSLQLDVYSRLAYENAARMLASNGSEAIAAGFELAITAAETAISIGDLSLASRATIMMLVKLRILGDKTEHVVSHYGVKVHELHDQVGELSVTYSHINEAATKVNQSIISQVDDDYSGKSIVVLVYGELGDDVDNLCATLLKRWEAHMARSTLQLIRSEEAHTSASNQLMAIDPRKLVVYSPHSSLRSINQQTYRWLYEHGVPILYGFATFPDIVNALHTFHSRSAAPVFTPTSCAEAVAAARRDLVNLWLAPEIDEHVVFLDGRPESTSWAKAIWRSLNALSSYAGARIVDRKVGTFRMWASANGGISAQQIKDKESEGTMNTPSLRAQRVFAVPSEFVASGSVVMESHIGIGVVMGCPRIHYCVESVDVIGRLCVGYVGQHLETLGTN
jgi:hypothetical protein